MKRRVGEGERREKGKAEGERRRRNHIIKLSFL